MSREFKISQKSMKANRKTAPKVPEPEMPEVDKFINVRSKDRGTAKRAYAQSVRKYRNDMRKYEEAARSVDTPIDKLHTFINGPGEAFLRAVIRAEPVAPIEIEIDDVVVVIEVKSNINGGQ